MLFSFMSIFMCWALQDISIDGWSVTLVKEENLSNAATSQMIGMKFGAFLSTSVYYALTSLNFWNQFIYFTKRNEPILNESLYFKIWGVLMLLIALYVITFSDEKNDRILISEEDDQDTSCIKENIKIGIMMFKNKQIQICILFFLLETLFSSFNSFTGTMILLNNLKYSQENFSIVSFFNFPISLLGSILLAKYIKSNPFSTMYWLVIWKAIYDIIFVNLILYFYFEGIYYDILIFTSQLIDSIILSGIFTSRLSYANIVSNPKVASTHITLITSISNMCVMIPRFYTFTLVEHFGIYLPNLIGCILTLAILLGLQSHFTDPVMLKKLKIKEN